MTSWSFSSLGFIQPKVLTNSPDCNLAIRRQDVQRDSPSPKPYLTTCMMEKRQNSLLYPDVTKQLTGHQGNLIIKRVTCCTKAAESRSTFVALIGKSAPVPDALRIMECFAATSATLSRYTWLIRPCFHLQSLRSISVVGSVTFLTRPAPIRVTGAWWWTCRQVF